MKLYVPHYYKDFKCIASECKDNCCYGGWEIDIDDETAKYYMNLEGEFGDRLRNNIDCTDEYCFKLEDGHCPFLDDHNLCQIYQNLGEDKMGVVCTQFPRYSEYYGAIKETGIGLACEEAQRIIFEDKEPFHLVEMEIDEEPVDDPEYDKKLADSLFLVRNKIFGLIEDTNISIHQILSIILGMGNQIQELVNQEQQNDQIYNQIAELGKLKVKELYVQFMKNEYTLEVDVQDSIDRIIAAYQNLEILNQDWPDFMDLVVEKLHSEDISITEYQNLYSQYWNYHKENEYQYRNILKYFIYRYFMKSAYDHDVYAKVLMTITNFLIIREMDLTRWLVNNKVFTFEDQVDTVHIFSREVEYSEDNLEDLKEEFLFDDIFDYENMNQLLLALDQIR